MSHCFVLQFSEKLAIHKYFSDFALDFSRGLNSTDNTLRDISRGLNFTNGKL